MRWIYFVFILMVIFISSCGLREREKAVQRKEAALTSKEQELLLREEALRQKEEALAQKEQRSDSIPPDSAFTYNSEITGLWNVRMVCIETTCPGSAIGDIKSETWDLAYENNQVIAKAMTDNTVVRTYTGTYSNNLLELRENVELSSNSPATEIIVRLTLLNNHALEGQRQIIRGGDCRIVYSLQLEKSDSETILN